eukprot:TRINITY_DN46983_c0_g1_i1.p2 TRINITY_DN46983_c0_g1~~TRINITY_DN46983_c0_g1_i1.p2  ORF type:complete len:103 (-),score=4.23 TRINITY_DN46983_c0_g1_i1:129-437(-)
MGDASSLRVSWSGCHWANDQTFRKSEVEHMDKARLIQAQIVLSAKYVRAHCVRRDICHRGLDSPPNFTPLLMVRLHAALAVPPGRRSTGRTQVCGTVSGSFT